MIRKYKETDTEAIIAVWYASSSLAHPFLDAAFMEKEKQNIRDIYLPNTETWVYETEDSLDGFISMIGNEVGAIFVTPEKHGLGIGKQLMDWVAQLHAELEVEVFTKNTIGRAFYDRYGFVTQKSHLHEETGNELLRMKFTK